MTNYSFQEANCDRQDQVFMHSNGAEGFGRSLAYEIAIGSLPLKFSEQREHIATYSK